MYIVLSSFRWKTRVVYLDDVIVFSKTFRDHLNDVQEVLSCLSEAGFSLKFPKYTFFKKQVAYLGHTVMPGN